MSGLPSQPHVARDPAPAIIDAPPAAAFTPGPWEWDSGVIPPDGPGRYSDIYVDGGDKIIASVNEFREFSPDEGRANARLIAAAPDLLEALQWVMSAHGEQLHDAFDAAHKAIAKALTGQSEAMQHGNSGMDTK